MSGYKDTVITGEDDQEVVDICDHCGEAIQRGQIVWKVGSEMYCNRTCLDSGLKIITLRI